MKDDAICIRQWDWSETSQTVSLFARDTGVMRGVAKGSKRENSRFSGGVEVLTRGAVVAIVKATDGLATLTAWDLQETFPAVRRTLGAFYAGMYIADLVHHAVRDSDPHPGLFDAMVAALRGLGTAQELHASVLRFQWAALVETGFKPELDRDVAAGGALMAAASYGFSPGLGGLVQVDDEGGGRGIGGRGPSMVWRVRAATVDLLRSLESGSAWPEASEKTVARANRLLATYWREVLGAEIPSMGAYVGLLEES